jgi:hypothetical protein
MPTKLTLAFAVLLLPLVAAAEIYQWKDADGKTQYSDQPPPAAARQERTITPRLAPAAVSTGAAPTSAPRSYQDQEAAFKERKVQEEEANARQDKTQSTAEERKRNCEMAQGNLKNIQVGGRQVRYDPQTGGRVYLSEEEIALSLKDAQRSVDEWCKPQTAQR